MSLHGAFPPPSRFSALPSDDDSVQSRMTKPELVYYELNLTALK